MQTYRVGMHKNEKVFYSMETSPHNRLKIYILSFFILMLTSVVCVVGFTFLDALFWNSIISFAGVMLVVSISLPFFIKSFFSVKTDKVLLAFSDDGFYSFDQGFIPWVKIVGVGVKIGDMDNIGPMYVTVDTVEGSFQVSLDRHMRATGGLSFADIDEISHLISLYDGKLAKRQ